MYHDPTPRPAQPKPKSTPRHCALAKLNGNAKANRLRAETKSVPTSPNRRFLAIELACPRTVDAQIATLAHELQHVVEIAHAPWVLSPRTLREYYEAIGMEVTAGAPGRMFETRAAAAVGELVRREMNSSSTSASRH